MTPGYALFAVSVQHSEDLYSRRKQWTAKVASDIDPEGERVKSELLIKPGL